MFILKLAGKILLLPVWLILFVIGLAMKMTVQTYAVVRGILGFIFTLLIIATAYCYHDWVQVAFLFVLSTILYLILFVGVLYACRCFGAADPAGYGRQEGNQQGL